MEHHHRQPLCPPLLAVCLLLVALMSSAAEGRRKKFVEIKRYPDGSLERHYSSTASAIKRSDSEGIVAAESHCWIRVERRGKSYDVDGTCLQLSKGVYACQNKNFVDPFNPYCKFMD